MSPIFEHHHRKILHALHTQHPRHEDELLQLAAPPPPQFAPPFRGGYTPSGDYTDVCEHHYPRTRGAPQHTRLPQAMGGVRLLNSSTQAQTKTPESYVTLNGPAAAHTRQECTTDIKPLFDALAQFVSVYEGIQQDLFMPPTLTPDQRSPIVKRAVTVFAELIHQVAKT